MRTRPATCTRSTRARRPENAPAGETARAPQKKTLLLLVLLVSSRAPPSLFSVRSYDWNMATSKMNPPVQGGMLVARPSTAVFDALVETVRQRAARRLFPRDDDDDARP